MRVRKPRTHYVLFMLVTAVSVILICSPAISLLFQNVFIQFNGTIGSLSSVTALSGEPEELQAAIDIVNAAGGGTVYIPAGTFHWNGETVQSYGGVNIIGASPAGCMGHESNWQSYIATTILHNDAVGTLSYNVPNMLNVDGSNGKPFRISGIQFEATPPEPVGDNEWQQSGCAIDLSQGKNFRLDHCTFINFAGIAVRNRAWGSVGTFSYGLIDHCVIDVAYKDTEGSWQGGYGWVTAGNMFTDKNNFVAGAQLYAGKYEAIPDVALTIVEDCHASRCRHAIDGADGAVIAVRYSLFDNPAAYLTQSNNIGDICAHGGGWGTMCTTVLLEAYNNVITGKANFGTTAIRIRGGSGLFYNNDFNPPDNGNPSWAQAFVMLDADSSVPEFQVKQTYIWDNSYSNCNFIWNSAGRVENVDYFLRAPTLAQDGWTYTPYTYPHPLTSG